MQKGPGNKQFSIESIKDKDLRAYVQHLSSSLNKQNQELKIKSLNNNIFKAIFKSANFQQTINNVLDEIRINGCCSTRLLIISKESVHENDLIKAESGRNTQAYAYLDDQIIQQLKNKKQIIIPDTTKIHSIKFTPDKEYPKTIAAYHFMQLPSADGYLWMSFDAIKEFTDFELDLITQLTSVLADVCEFSLLQDEIRIKAGAYEQVLEKFDIPIIILNRHKEIIYASRNANGQFNGQYKNIFSNQSICSWMDSVDADTELELEIGGRHYQVVGRQFVNEENNGMAVLLLTDDTELNNRQAYLTLILDTISHDFKVPLINLQGFSKLLSMVGELNQKQGEYLESIRTGVEEISTVVNDLFEISRIIQEDGLKKSECSSKEILEKVVSLVQAEARQKRLEIEQQPAPNDLSIEVDQVLIVSAIYNLLTNAIKHSRIGGIITVEEKVNEQYWEVSIQDCGKGMSQIDIEKMESSSFHSKEGQGLSIVDRIARFHRGKLIVKSELGKGSKFILQLPCFE